MACKPVTPQALLSINGANWPCVYHVHESTTGRPDVAKNACKLLLRWQFAGGVIHSDDGWRALCVRGR